MSQRISLKEAERRAFRKAHNDGLWDIFLGCFFLMFAIAPSLSVYLGDFWSSAIFLPFWGIIFLVIWLVRRRVVVPRIGIVKFGAVRKKKLMIFTLAMLAVNLISFFLGLFFASRFSLIPGYLPMLVIGLFFLTGFSLAGYLLDYNRLYLYGLLTGFSPMVGEWLYTYRSAPHHGLTITFGISSGIMVLVGLITFVCLLRDNPLPVNHISSENV
jgi:MFS family permease